jgi:pyruvate/2-oxoglutarate/acetoin dehydrogenase E1 component
MKTKTFAQAIEAGIAQAMAENTNIVYWGEDIHTLRANLYTRFGKDRIKSTPISESAFLGAGVTAAMAGLHPIVEIMLVDFIAVAMDAVLNHASKVYAFSGNKWNVPLTIRTSCGGGYGDAGQHEQCLWGMLAHMPGLSIVIPSNPADAARLMYTALKMDSPVIYFEHKLLADYWLDYLGLGGRNNIPVNVPESGAKGTVPDSLEGLSVGESVLIKEGSDVTLISLGVGVHRCIEAAQKLIQEGTSAEIIDLRWVVPLDMKSIVKSVQKTKKLVVVDEDYTGFGLSGEIAAQLLEQNIVFQFARVCTDNVIPFNRNLEEQTLPNVERIITAVKSLK